MTERDEAAEAAEDGIDLPDILEDTPEARSRQKKVVTVMAAATFILIVVAFIWWNNLGI